MPEKINECLNQLDANRRAAGAQVHRFRRLSKSDGLLEAGRHRNFRDATRLPLGSFCLSNQEGAECVHGKTGDGRRPDEPADVRTG